MKPLVSIIMGSTSDWPVMKKAADLFESMEIVKSNRWGANLNNIQFQKLKKWYELYKFS